MIGKERVRMPVLDPTTSPSAILGLIETSPYLKRMGISIEGGAIRKIRPKEDGKLEVQYQFELVNTATAETSTATVLGKFYPDDKGEKKYLTLLENLRGAEYFAAGSTLRGFAAYFADGSLRGFACYIPALRLLLQTPLEDKKLTGLELALDAERMKSFLAGYVGVGVPGPESIRTCAIDILRYKPGNRCTLRYRLEGVTDDDRPPIAEEGSPSAVGGRRASTCHAQRPFSVIGKLYGDGREGPRIFAIMGEMARLGFGRDAADGIRIPQPYGFIPGLQMVLMEDVPSPSLKQNLASPTLDEHLQRVARALQKIHHCPLSLIRSQRVLKKFSAAGRVSNLSRGVSKATKACPALRLPLKASLKGLKALAPSIYCPLPVLIHGALYPAECLMDGNVLTILDLDNLCNADPAIDLGNFLGHLRWKSRQLEWSPEEARRHEETFLKAYRADMPPDLMHRIDFYTRASMLRIAARLALQPENLPLASALLEETMRGYTVEQRPRVW
jgi:hypothetical protein